VNSECGHEAKSQRLLITTSRTTWAERDEDDKFSILPEDFNDPDHIQAELVCLVCRWSRLLADDEWEVA
jgi:hypothetical protein